MSKLDNSKGLKSYPVRMDDLDSAFEHRLEPRRCTITVGWGDCDPAQIAYTARIPEWTLLAIESWYSYCLESDWYEINLKRGIGTPFVSLGFDFYAPITPRFPLEMAIFVSKLGNASLSHHVEGFQNEVRCFAATTTACFVEATSMNPVAIPPNMRRNIENYIQHQGRKFDQA